MIGVFVSDDILMIIQFMTNKQRQYFEDVFDNPEHFEEVLTELGYGYWMSIFESFSVDVRRASRIVAPIVTDSRFQRLQLGVTLEHQLFQLLKNNEDWLAFLDSWDCKVHPSAVETALFNGIYSGEYSRILETLSLLRFGKIDVVYTKRVCPAYDKTCLFCKNGIQFYPAGTTYLLSGAPGNPPIEKTSNSPEDHV